eukprot:CAMPEP_0206439040 /NCGR_PEP_ID=MMETSP0324_2-20121206/11981_1 /ASSEMBLY_ACC=CAM_ASM_000836 /TAXON_ID=2866 /ORGANISM="Crypthecodinium cohnii, Strain Seligo" /LENGTH=49 /DNA_ID=CAMNT_0053906599 /DNA_START=753 /DNA_END=902 /DNA_ORIENTATION=+
MDEELQMLEIVRGAPPTIVMRSGQGKQVLRFFLCALQEQHRRVIQDRQH